MAWEYATYKIAVFLIRFSEAQTVFAMGGFNNWSTTATPLRGLEDDLWELTLPVGVNVQDVCFFVLRKGETVGRVRSYPMGDVTPGEESTD